MTISIRSAVLAAALAIALPLVAHATSYETASFVDESVAGGDYFIDNTNFLGASFSVLSNESLNSVGGNFTAFGDGGTLFAAVLSSTGSVVAETTFTPIGGDQSVALNGALDAGTYTVVFGSGLFGATGSSGLVAAQTAIGTPSFVQLGGTLSNAQAFTGDTLRVTMVTSPVPEPEPMLLLGAGALFLAFAAKRRAR
jgi:hypothetical protein